MAIQNIEAQATRRNPEELLEHLNSFELDLKFSAGVWFFFPGGGRFHDVYQDRPDSPDQWLERVFEIAESLKPHGLRGLEAHYPNEVNEENIDRYVEFGRQTGIRLVTIVPNLFFERRWEFGALSSPIPDVRRAAIERTRIALELNKQIDTDFAIVWPGIDGYENSFGTDFIAARDRFCQGLAEAMDAVPGVRVAEEPKPYEPRAHILYGTTPEGILMAQKTESLLRSPENRSILEGGDALVGLNPEVGHVLMGYEDLPYALSLVMEYGRLFHTHWNAQPLGNYDQDQNVGAISPDQAEAGLYALKMQGYSGYFGIDINPERMPVDRAIINCIDALKAMNERINRLDHEKVLACTTRPQKNRGLLEALITRARAPEGAPLSEMPPVE
ncbi:MAG: xylose isomerase [Planctomycetes bacterium]|nr:xylose isomerase [Planctomycetota bacterium]